MILSLLFSTVAILVQMVTSYFVRKGIERHLTDGSILKEASLEMVASAELCGTCYELIIIADNYGILAYAFYLFVMTVWWGRSWGSATACTYSILEDYVENGGSLTMVILKGFAQVIGGLISFRWVKQLWILELTADHLGRGVEFCSADLQVSVMMGFVIECILTCLCRLTSRILCEKKPNYADFIDSFFGTAMVCLAFNMSGGYFNPVLATGLKWGCHGHTHTEHILVYWAGAILGSMFALKLWNSPQLKNKLLDAVDLSTSLMQRKQTAEEQTSEEGSGVEKVDKEEDKDSSEKDKDV